MTRRMIVCGLLLAATAACGGPEPTSKTPVIVIEDDVAADAGTTHDRSEVEPDADADPMPATVDPDMMGEPGEPDEPDEPPMCNLDCSAPPPRCRGLILEVPRGTASCDLDTYTCEGETWDEIRCADAGQICADGACIDTPKRAFLSTARYDGDILSASGAFEGAAAADELCQLEADGSLLGGTWRAWISSASTDAIDRIADVGPWYLVDGVTLVANNLAELATAGPRTDIDMHPNRGLEGDFGAWTGTGSSGRWTGEDCNGWTTDSFTVEGTFGVSSVVTTAFGGWTDRGGGDCDIERHLYCIEQ